MLDLLAMSTAVTLWRASTVDERSSLGVPVHHRTGRRRTDADRSADGAVSARVDVDVDETFADALPARAASTGRGAASDAAGRESRRPGSSRCSTCHRSPTATSPVCRRSPAWMRSGHVDPTTPSVCRCSTTARRNDRWSSTSTTRLSADGSWHPAFVEHSPRSLDAALARPDAEVGDFEIATAGRRRRGGGAATCSTRHRRCRPSRARAGPRADPPPDSRADPDRVVAEHDGAELTGWRARPACGRSSRAGWAIMACRPAPRSGSACAASIDVLVAVHGVLRAGAAFVMLDPDDPAARHDAIAADADLALILDDACRAGRRCPPTPIDADSDCRGRSLDDIAYVLYTSGSTGRAEGCADLAPRARRLPRASPRRAYADRAAAVRDAAALVARVRPDDHEPVPAVADRRPHRGRSPTTRSTALGRIAADRSLITCSRPHRASSRSSHRLADRAAVARRS